MFAELSHGISLTHRQGILDGQIFKGMDAYVKESNTIHLPASSYFHDDPIRQLTEARQRRFIITVGPFKSPEILQRRARAKLEIGQRWEELRKEFVAEEQPYEQQLELEVHGHWEGLVELLKKFEADMRAGRYDFWGFMGPPALYFTGGFGVTLAVSHRAGKALIISSAQTISPYFQYRSSAVDWVRGSR